MSDSHKVRWYVWIQAIASIISPPHGHRAVSQEYWWVIQALKPVKMIKPAGYYVIQNYVWVHNPKTKRYKAFKFRYIQTNLISASILHPLSSHIRRSEHVVKSLKKGVVNYKRVLSPRTLEWKNIQLLGAHGTSVLYVYMHTAGWSLCVDIQYSTRVLYCLNPGVLCGEVYI